MPEDTDYSQFDIVRVLLVILLATIVSTIIIVSFTDADTPYDSIDFGVQLDCEGEDGSHCPHAMLIRPIDNSEVGSRDVELTLYVYDDDDTVWFLNVTFYDNSTDSVISALSCKSDFNISTVWTNLIPGNTYEWYGYLENSSGGTYTTEIYSFTVGTDVISGASDFWGTWMLLAIIIGLIVTSIVLSSRIFIIFTLIVTIIITTFYTGTIMDTSSVFDEMLGWVFLSLLFFVFVELAYLVFWGKK